MSRSIRITALALAILAFFIFVGSPFQSAARAVAGIDDAIIAIIIAACAACGITFAVIGSYGSLQEYIGELLEEWVESRGTTIGKMFKGCQSGVNKLGQIILNNRFVIVIDLFVKYLKTRFSLEDNSMVSAVSGAGMLGNCTAYLLPVAFYQNNGNAGYEYHVVTGDNVYAVILNVTGNYQLRFVSNESTSVRLISYLSNGQIHIGDPEELTWYEAGQKYRKNSSIGFSGSAYSEAFSGLDVYTLSQYNTALLQPLIEGSAPIDIYTDDIVSPLDDPNYRSGDGAILDVGADWGIDYPGVTEVVIPGEFTGVDLGEAEMDYVPEDEAAEQVEQSAEQVISQNPADYQVNGLSSVFPFCIPFDLYNFVECLAAEPETPQFTWRFYVPGICDETIDIDLTPFNGAAQILRTMELLLFCVGLAFVTRRIIRG